MDDNPANWRSDEAREFVERVAGEAKAPPEKRPLFRALPPAPAFPVDALGPLGNAATTIHQLTQAPIAIAAQSVLAATTLAVQAQRNLELPGGGRRPLTGIFVSIADSGERKSSVDRLALSAVHKVEEEWRQESETDRRTYRDSKEPGIPFENTKSAPSKVT
jgi:hypothetical protein